MVATTLDEAYLVFDPIQPLRGSLLNDYYVDQERQPDSQDEGYPATHSGCA